MTPDERRLVLLQQATLARVDRSLRLLVPAFFDEARLREHFAPYSLAWIKKAAKRWAGYHPRRGRAFALTQDQVLKIHDGVRDDGPDAVQDAPSLRIHSSRKASA